MVEVERTLVKSPPELWGLVDNEERLRAWTRELLGGNGEIEIAVVDRAPESHLAWESAGDRSGLRLELAIEKKGWGTQVTLCGEAPSGIQLETFFERLLDELGSPQKRPFARA
jgi:hypothetical protein